MGDNKLSILIQAKIDEQSTKTMQGQLDSLAKNLKSVKIAIDLGDVENQFKSLITEVAKESKKVAMPKANFDSLEDAVGHMQKLQKSAKHVADELRQLGNVKSVTENFSTQNGDLVGFKVQIEEMKDNLKSLQDYNVLAKFNEETKEWGYEVDKVTMKLTDIDKHMTTSSYGKAVDGLVEQYRQGFLKIEDYYQLLNDMIYNKDGSKFSEFDKLDSSVQKDFMRELETAQKNHYDSMEQMDKLHAKALTENRKVDAREEKMIRDAQLEDYKRTKAKEAELEAMYNKALLEDYKRTNKKKEELDEAHRLALKENAKKDADKKQLDKDIGFFKQDMANKLAKLQTTKNVDSDQFKALRKAVKEVSVETENARQAMSNLHKELALLDAESGKKFKNASHAMSAYEQNIRTMNHQYELGILTLDDYEKKLKTVLYKPSSTDFSSQFGKLNPEVQIEFFNKLKSLQKEVEQNEIKHNKELMKKDELYLKIDKKMQQLNKIGVDNKKYDTAEFSRLEKAYEDLIQEIYKGNITLDEARLKFNQLDNEVKQFENTSKKASKTSSTMSKTIKSFAGMYGVFEGIQFGKEVMREMVTQVKLLDDATVELTKVTDLQGDSMDAFVQRAYAVGDSVARVGSEVVMASAEFAKMGASAEESLKLAENAMIYANVGDNVSTDDATKTIISTMKAFKIEAEDTIQIIDKINAVSNNFAISSAGLGEALTNSASSLMEANNSLDETLALYAVGNTITQDPSKVSNGLRTISMRLRGVDEDTGNLIPKFRELFLEYTNGQVDIMKTNDEFKSTYEIISELSKHWSSFTDLQKASLAEMSAGKNRANIFVSLMNSAEDLDKALETSMNSMGSAMAENEKAMDSIQGKMNAFSSAFQSLSANTISSDFIKNIIDLGTALITLVDKIGITNIALLGFIGYLSFFGKSNWINSGINSIAKCIESLAPAFAGATGGAMALSTAMAMIAPVAIVGLIMGVVGGLKLLHVSVEEQRVKVQDLTAEYESLTAELERLKGISNPTQADKDRIKYLEMEAEATKRLADEAKALLIDKEVFGRKDWNPFDGGKLEDATKQMESLKTVYSDIEKVKANLDNLQTNGGSADEIKRTADHLEFLQGILIASVPDLNSYKTLFEETLESITDPEDRKALEEVIALLTDELNKIDGETKLTGVANGMDQVAESSKNLLTVVENLSIESKKTMESVGELDGAIKTLTDGGQLSADTIIDLCNTYPQLRDQLVKTKDGYTLNKEALIELRNESINTTQTNIDNEIAHTKVTIENTKARINSYKQEITAIKTVAQAKQALAKTYEVDYTNDALLKTNPLMPDMLKQGYQVANKNAMSDVVAQQRKDLSELAEQLGALEALERQAQDLMIFGTNSYSSATTPSSKKSSSGGKKSEQRFAKYIEKGLDDDIKAIKSKSDDLAKEIEMIQNKISVASAKGDTKGELELIKDLEQSFEKQKALLHTQANDLRALRDKMVKEISSQGIASLKGMDLENVTEKQLSDILRGYEKAIDNANVAGNKSTEASLQMQKAMVEEYLGAIIKVNEEIHGMSSEWWKVREQEIQKEIELINRKYDLERRLLDDKIEMLEIEQMLLKETSDRWLEIEDEKYYAIVEKQESLSKQIKQFLDDGYDMEDEHVRDLIKLYGDYERQRINQMKEYGERAKKEKQKQLQEEQKMLEEGQKGVQTILDMTMKMLKQQYEDEKKAIEENSKAKEDAIKQEMQDYDKLIQKKKDALNSEKSERDYQKGLKEKEKKIKETEDKILALSNDSSKKAEAERRKLEEELAKYKEDLADYQYDYSLDKQQEALDEEQKRFEEQKQAELDAIQKQKEEELKKIQEFLDKEGNLREEAIKLIESKNRDLYDKLIQWNKDYGDGLDSTVTSAWEACTDALDKYGGSQESVLDTLNAIADKLKEVKQDLIDVSDSSWQDYVDEDDFNPSGGSGGSSGSSGSSGSKDERAERRDEVIYQMRANSRAWNGASKEEQARLAKENEKLAKEIGAWKSQKDGNWYVKINGKDYNINNGEGIGVRHTGIETGFVGGKARSQKSNEFLNLLEEGELVVNTKQMDNFMNNIMPNVSSMSASTTAPISINIEKMIEVESIDSSTNIEDITKRAVDELYKQMSNMRNTMGTRVSVW